ncbi:MAG: M24 family metallopeptidase [Nitrospiria bacterium]
MGELSRYDGENKVKANCLLIACSETDSNIYYASGFLAPDPYVFLSTNGQSYLLMSDLEIDRARAQSKVDHVFSYSEYEERARKNGTASPGLPDVVHALMQELDVKDWTVPADFPLEYGDAFRALGYHLAIKKAPFFEARAVKRADEVAAILQTQAAVEAALDEVIDLFRQAEIKEGFLYVEDMQLTSELIRQRLHLSLMGKGCIGQHTIVSCGIDGCDPHNEGSGPLRANESIILDIFPRSVESRYFADMTRTVVKGSPSDGLKRLYDAVLEGQTLGISLVKDGASGREIHEKISDLFEKKGYHTGKVNGRMQGFFHGTGHGLGLDIHEPPRISRSDWPLKEGEVVTVEPGLYYPDIGAVRIEDMVLVEKAGCSNLTSYPKFLEIK